MNPAATDRKVVQVVIAGRVLGVWFRAWTVEHDMVAACWGGPPLATVDAVDVSAWDQGVEPGFETRYGR